MATTNTYQYKIKDKKIALWEYETVKVNGVNTKVYSKVTQDKLWAYYRVTGGSASIQGSALKYWNTVEDCIFVINRNSTFTPKAQNVIVYNHKIYDITYVDDYEGYLTDWKINAKLATSQDFTKYNGLIDD